MSLVTPLRVVVLISGNGSNLQSIIDTSQQANAAIQISGVISNKTDAYGLKRAEQANIPTSVVDHTQYDSREDYDQVLLDNINTYQPDLVVLAGFMRILTPEFVQYFKGRLLNIHPSLLPKYRGLNTHQRALEAGDTEHGVSVHFVTEELDGGPIIMQSIIKISDNEQADTLQKRVQTKEHKIYPLIINWFAEKRLEMKNTEVFLDGVKLEMPLIYENLSE